MTKKITSLPPSDDPYWEDADVQRIEKGLGEEPKQWVREGNYAKAIGTPYDLSVALDWNRFDIVDGVIVVKSKQ